jgi:hypothetical protein
MRLVDQLEAPPYRHGAQVHIPQQLALERAAALGAMGIDGAPPPL